MLKNTVLVIDLSFLAVFRDLNVFMCLASFLKAKNIPLNFVMNGLEVNPYLYNRPDIQRIINLDAFSDFMNLQENHNSFNMHNFSWVDFCPVRWHEQSEYIWVHPFIDEMDFKYTGILEASDEASVFETPKVNKTQWKTVGSAFQLFPTEEFLERSVERVFFVYNSAVMHYPEYSYVVSKMLVDAKIVTPYFLREIADLNDPKLPMHGHDFGDIPMSGKITLVDFDTHFSKNQNEI